VNAQHLRAFFWLQWRLRVNQFKRGGIANQVLLAILAAGAVLLALGTFAGFLLIGCFLLADVSPLVLMVVWDGMVVAFLFFWMIGLVTDLQRSEALSLEKFLHLPVSLTGVFVLNYLSSLLSLTLIMFLPAMLGLTLGLILSRGAPMLLLVPLVAAFLLMVTALSYQFQGWLASLMVNKRRRRAVIVIVSAVFLVIVQLPNLLNFLGPWRSQQPDELAARLSEKEADLKRALDAGEITAQEYQRRHAEAQRDHHAQVQERNQHSRQNVERIAHWVNLVLPPGWLPWGARASAQGDALAPLLGTLGMTLIAAASLRRAYRTTVRLYTGQFTSGRSKAFEGAKISEAAPAAASVKAERAGTLLLERRLPWLSEPAAAIALGSFRSLTRAPEAKILLLTPIIMVVFFSAVFLRGARDLPSAARPLLVFGAMGMILLTLVQLVGNQFGFDRSGFRIFVLSPAPRRDILLGKNLAVAPLALMLGLATTIFVQVVSPLRLDHLLAMLPQMISMYLLFCLLANCLSILTPMAIAAGTLKPTNARLIPVLLQMLFVFLMPVTLAPTLLPLGVEVLLEALGWTRGLPVYLVLSVALCIAVMYLYRWLVTWQGVWLQSREQKILETVTTKAE
jgi:ABC-2 type transport system permease protein